MGLTNSSTGINSIGADLHIIKKHPGDITVALAGNPNVGKSTIFNKLTGMHQHTGNWPGKTVTNAVGTCSSGCTNFIFADIPGTYSLIPHSAEEETARDFICFGEPDAVVIVCDACTLERNLNLVLQTLELHPRSIVCVNLMDEAAKKGITLDLAALSERLGVPVVPTSARSGRGVNKLLRAIESAVRCDSSALEIKYPDIIEEAVSIVQTAIESRAGTKINPRWLALRLLGNDTSLIRSYNSYIKFSIAEDAAVKAALEKAGAILKENGITEERFSDIIVSSIVDTAEDICKTVVSYSNPSYNARDRKIDKILTGKYTAFPVMLIMLGVIFWITITGANYPSELLSDLLMGAESYIFSFLSLLKIPPAICNMLCSGVYRTLAWIVSVMLPPMAIFFPLFTLLEDLGLLPRIAFNLDKYFKKCCACGKQALTMCMGFGCNAAGVVGCRIIDSPRERLIAMITNSFVPCNGRFPILIAIITMFFSGNNLYSSLILLAVIVTGILLTFLVSFILSKTILKGQPSSFTLELPPFRRPQIGSVIVRSLLDRTIFVLGRAVMVAAPAGLIIWLLANVSVGGMSILSHIHTFLDPFGRLLGMDGVILLAFILGMPANEIVIPIIMMSYMATGTLSPFENLIELKSMLVANGWTWVTAVSTMLFTLVHWPCTTTLLSVKKETGSFKWTVAAFAIPTILGFLICFLFASIARLF